MQENQNEMPEIEMLAPEAPPIEVDEPLQAGAGSETVPPTDGFDEVDLDSPVSHGSDIDLAPTEEVKLEPHGLSKTVVQDSPTRRALDPKRSDNEVMLMLPSDTEERVRAAMEAIPKLAVSATNATRDLIAAIESGFEISPEEDMFDGSVSREDAAWRQSVKGSIGPMAAARPKFTAHEDRKLSGVQAVLRIQGLLGQGGIIQIPLWHSGFWITISTPSEGELLELERRISDEKILLGRVSNGRVFSNTSVFIANHIVDMLMGKIFDSSLKEQSPRKIRSLIRSHDIQHIAWGLACSIWPNGFKYARAILGETTDKHKVITEELNLSKLQWTDTSCLTERQIAHMSRRQSGAMTTESLEIYRNDFLKAQPSLFKLSDSISVLLSVPDVDTYLASGQRWINDIVATNDRLFGMDQDETTRNNYMIDQSRATSVRQYGHWVKGIVLDGHEADPYLMEDQPEVVEDMLNKMSANDSVRNAFFESVTTYMEDSTISVIAVPTVSASEEDVYPRFPHLLPIDALTTFFSLLAQKTQRIRSRV
jgi:hypothetical protein